MVTSSDEKNCCPLCFSTITEDQINQIRNRLETEMTDTSQNFYRDFNKFEEKIKSCISFVRTPEHKPFYSNRDLSIN